MISAVYDDAIAGRRRAVTMGRCVFGYVLMILVGLRVTSLAVHIHIDDSDLVVAESHLMMLVTLALGGPVAPRHFGVRVERARP